MHTSYNYFRNGFKDAYNRTIQRQGLRHLVGPYEKHSTRAQSYQVYRRSRSNTRLQQKRRPTSMSRNTIHAKQDTNAPSIKVHKGNRCVANTSKEARTAKQIKHGIT